MRQNEFGQKYKLIYEDKNDTHNTAIINIFISNIL